jgi:arylsulfatase A-like enzyme
MVEAADQRVGRLVAALDRLGLREKTLILFTGDNGTPRSYIATAVDGKLVRKSFTSKMGDLEVRGGKGSLTNAGTNVPLIANWKGTIPPGQVVDDLVDFSDFLPTFAELAGADLPEGVDIDGVSFAPRLCGREGKGRAWAFAEHRGKCWVRTQQWKLYDDGRLFDVPSDPGETHAISVDAASPEATAARKKLQAALDRVLQGRK